MSWSLQLRNGDLVVDGTKLGQVTGAQKLAQDLRCCVLERMGTDSSHPTFGSLIDGGIDPSGQEVLSVIGEQNIERVALVVESELRRIMAEHQQRQITRAQNDRMIYGQSTLTTDELLLNVDDIEMNVVQDSLFVSVRLTTGAYSQFQVSLPFTPDLV